MRPSRSSRLGCGRGRPRCLVIWYNHFMPGRHAPLADRFWRYAIPSEGCWIWRGSVGTNGYPRIKAPAGVRPTVLSAHRVGYEIVVGPIPEGLELDHLCKTPLCVNPAHLEPVTRSENARRLRTNTVLNTGVCHRGHDSSIHGYEPPGKPGVRMCRQCKRDRRAAERQRVFDSRTDRTCRWCGGPIKAAKRSDALYCSAKCRSAFRHRSGAAPAGH